MAKNPTTDIKVAPYPQLFITWVLRTKDIMVKDKSAKY